MIRLAIALLTLASCVRNPPVQRVTIPDVVKVEITNTKPDCYFPDTPPEIEEPAWPTSDEDLYRRQYVHRRDHGLAIQHMKDQDQVITALVECVRALTTPRD